MTNQLIAFKVSLHSNYRLACYQLQSKVTYMEVVKLVALAVLVASGSSTATSSRASDVDGVIQNLDLTTFPNSTGPRRLPERTTFADYGFVIIKKIEGGAEIVRDDRGWEMSFTIPSATPTFLHLCFFDKGLGRPGNGSVPSYNSTSALLVTKSRKGRWSAKQVAKGFPSCQNDPAEA